jgi:hypothetical protein
MILKGKSELLGEKPGMYRDGGLAYAIKDRLIFARAIEN